MERVVDLITKEPIWATVTSVIASKVVLYKESKWKTAKEKSPRDKALAFLIQLMVVGGVLWFISVVFVNLFNLVLGIKAFYSEIFWAGISLCTIYVIYRMEKKPTIKKNIAFCSKEVAVSDKFQEGLGKAIFFCATMIVSTLFLLYFFPGYNLFTNIVRLTSFIALALFIFSCIFFLENERPYKYQYATFYLNNGTIIENAKIETLMKKGKWVIAGTDNEEYRFKERDILRVKYSNSRE